MHASDTLKVKKVTFFIEPKAIVYAPIQKAGTIIYKGYSDNDYIPYVIQPNQYYGNYTQTIRGKNNTTLSFGLSAGMSFRLNKYLYYQLSAMYYHVYQSAKNTETMQDSTGKYFSNITYTQKTNIDFIGISNGLTLRIKNILFTNSFMLGGVIHSKYKGTKQENTPTTATIGPNYACGCVETGFENFVLLLESKVGYSFLNGKIEPSIGVIISPSNKLQPLYNEYNAFPLMLSTSIKTNF